MTMRSPPQARPRRRSNRPRMVMAGALVLGVLGVLGLAAVMQLGGFAPVASPSIAGAGQSSVVAGSPPAGSPTGQGGTPSAATSPAPSPSSAATPGAIVAVPIVPVADYRTTATAITKRDVDAVLAGASHRWTTLELVADQSKPILDAMHLSPGARGIVEAPDASALMADLAAHRDRLGFLRADEVGPGVRALGWDTRHLFGVHRLKSVGTWSLTARLPASAQAAYDPATTWTMFAAGDLGLDRTYAYVVKNLGKGMNYPFDGGTARIARLVCCSPFGWKVPTIVSTGHPGAMRDLISSADLALANMEESAPTRFSFHPHGTVFTGDPALIAGIAKAGIDVASVASTHIGDGGRAGILQTIASLKKNGIVPFGAGTNWPPPDSRPSSRWGASKSPSSATTGSRRSTTVRPRRRSAMRR